MNIINEMKYTAYSRKSIEQSDQWHLIPSEHQEAIKIISLVLPFKVNKYVLDNLIDWNNIPDDPIYRLIFPHKDMLTKIEYETLKSLVQSDAPPAELQSIIQKIRHRMNPHPAGQLSHNVPMMEGMKLPGIQHKYNETVLFFPSAGQTCHAYCTFCFRWPQFIGDTELKFDARNSDNLVKYLKNKKEVSDVLITGGDPLVMNASSLRQYIEPLLCDDLSHIKNIRIGTKAISYWPYRFLNDKDSDHLLDLFKQVVQSGRNLALMAHLNHPKEIDTPVAQQAIKNIIATGATVRVQAPIIRHINDNAQAWIDLWNKSVNLGAIPYYMFVERDTGPNTYFHMPLYEAYNIFKEAYRNISGLGRTVRGPSMSAFNGKVLVDGIVEINGKKAFALQYLQARDINLVRRPFFAHFDEKATWFDQLTPFSRSDEIFFEPFCQGQPKLVLQQVD